jgi:hypothetical protein
MDAAVGAHSAHCGAQHSAQRATQAAEQVGTSDFYTWADIQRRGPILAWIVILSFYGADTIAEVKL